MSLLFLSSKESAAPVMHRPRRSPKSVDASEGTKQTHTETHVIVLVAFTDRAAAETHLLSAAATDEARKGRGASCRHPSRSSNQMHACTRPDGN